MLHIYRLLRILACLAPTIVILNLSISAQPLATDGRTSPSPSLAAGAPVQLKGGGLRFTINRGQIVDTRRAPRPDILYSVNGGGTQLFVSHDAISYVFLRWVNDEPAEHSYVDPAAEARRRGGAAAIPVGHLDRDRVDMQLVGANRAAEIVAEEESADRSNFYYDYCPKGITDVPSYGRLLYRDIYPHIDLVLHSKDGHLKYDFVVHPGGRASDIAWRYAGADSTKLAGGMITASSELGRLKEDAPYAYQGDNSAVACSYRSDGDRYGFEIGAYDESSDLVIDPTVLWATYFGGTGSDLNNGNAGITVDAAGDIGAIGGTFSTDFPVTPGAQRGTNSGGLDVFIMKMRSTGALVWCTYLGGPNNESGRGIAVDTLGRYAIVGLAPDEFPTGGALFQGAFAGSIDAFIGLLDTLGRAKWLSYFGGANSDIGEDVAFDSNGDIVMVGETGSDNFPVIGGWRSTRAGTDDGFIAKFRTSGLLTWSSYYGGTQVESFNSVAVNPDRTIVVVGSSNSEDFPMIGTPFQMTRKGSVIDAIVIKVNPSGTPIWSTYYGGNSNTRGTAVAVDPKGNVIIGGVTTTIFGPPTPDLPTSSTSFQQNMGGGGDGFVARFNSAGTHLWSTYLGGSDTDYVRAIATSSVGDIYVGGGTHSANFPVTTATAYQGASRGLYDATVMVFDSNGARRWGTYYGGSGTDLGFDVTFGVASLYLIGYTNSTNLTGTATGFQPASAGGDEAFIVRFNGFCPIPVPKLNVSGPLTFCEGDSLTLTAASGYAQYKWSNNATTQALVVKSSGTYSVTVTDGDICTATSASVKVLVHKKPVANISPAGVVGICQGDSVRLDAFHNDIVTYRWSNNDSLPRIWVKDSGTYVVNVIDTAGCTNVSLPVVVKITQKPARPVLATTDTVWICPDSVFYLSGGPGYANYTWYPSRKTGQFLKIDSAGRYSVEVNNIPGCNTMSDTVTVLIYPRVPAKLNVSGTQFLCNGDTLMLNVPAGKFTAPLWSTGAFTPSLAVTGPGVYFVTVTDSNGCRVSSDSVRVTMHPTPKADIAGPVSVCGGATPIYSTRTVGTLTYQWSITGDGTIVGPSDARSITVRWGSSGGGRLTLQVKDTSTGCGSTGSVDVTIGTSLKPTIAPSGVITLCAGDSVELDAGAGYDTYAWSNGATSRTIWVKDSLGYAVTVQDASGCRGTSDTVRATLETPAPPVVDGPVKVCRNTTASYNVRDTTGTDYQWSATGGTIASGGGTPHASVQWGAGPNGSLTVVVTSLHGCRSTATVPVEIGSQLKPAITPGGSITLCAGDSLTLDAGAGYTSYAWSTGATTETITIKSAGSYTVTVGDAGGCSGTSDPVTVQMAAPPVVAIAPGGSLRLNPGDTLVLDAGSGYAAYSWSREGAAAGSTRTLVARDTGSYAVRVTDQNGCTATATAHIEPNNARADVALDDIQATPGEHIEVPLRLVSSQDLALSGATSFEARIRYPAVLLIPTGATPRGTIDGADRVLTISGALPAGMTTGELARIEFIAAISDTTSGMLKLEQVTWKGAGGGERAIGNTLRDGSFTVTGLCTNGGARLVRAGGSEGLKAVIPNPASGSVRIMYDLVETGRCRIAITDLLGREVAQVFAGDRTSGAYEAEYDVRELATGSYVIVLETPSGRVSTTMQVVR